MCMLRSMCHVSVSSVPSLQQLFDACSSSLVRAAVVGMLNPDTVIRELVLDEIQVRYAAVALMHVLYPLRSDTKHAPV